MSIGFIVDIMMAVIGFAAAAVVIVYVWRFLQKKEEAESVLPPVSFPKPDAIPKKPEEKNSQPKKPTKTVLETAGTKKTTTARESPQPYLKAVRLQLKSERVLHLILKNQNGTIKLDKVEAGENNELEVKFDPPLAKTGAHVYGPGAEICLQLHGDKVVFKTYEIWLYFSTTQGQRYRQQIAGLGKEYPIVEKPQTTI